MFDTSDTRIQAPERPCKPLFVVWMIHSSSGRETSRPDVSESMFMQSESKLSYLQRNILKWLLEATEYAEEHSRFSGALACWGVRWCPSKLFGDWTPTLAASISRAIQRLEARELVLRQNSHTGTPDSGRARTSAADTPPKRTTNLLLTDKGREVAKRLTKSSE